MPESAFKCLWSSGERNGNPVRYSCLENSMDQGTWWAICSPWGCKESDTTERLTLSHSPEVQIDHLDVNHGLDKEISFNPQEISAHFSFLDTEILLSSLFPEGRGKNKWEMAPLNRKSKLEFSFIMVDGICAMVTTWASCNAVIIAGYVFKFQSS